jgi:hypothetical protein
MVSHKTALCLDSEIYEQFLELKQSFDDLNPTLGRQFVSRNGFNLSGYPKDFVESAIMVMFTLGRITGDIEVERGKFKINSTNFEKSNLLRERKIPKKWSVVSQWVLDGFQKYERF